MRRHRRPVPNFDVGIRSLARLDAIQPIPHVILVRSLTDNQIALPIHFLRKIPDTLNGLSTHHVRRARQMLDRAITAEDPLPQTVVLVAESGLPGHRRLGKIQSDGNRIRHLPPVFLGKHTARHVSRRRHRQIQRRHNPGDLMHHVLGNVPAGKLPEQPPINKFVRIELPVRAPVQKRLPIHVRRRAIRRHRTYPLPRPMRSIAAHPRLNLRNFSDHSTCDPFLSVGQGPGTLMLQPNLNHAVRFLRNRQTLFRFRNRPSHSLLAV